MLELGMFVILLVISIILLYVLFWQASLLLAVISGSPIVFADKEAIRACFRLAGLQPGQTVIDLGCGDGRALIIAAREFGAKGIGVDRSFYSFWRSRFNLWRSGQSAQVKIVRGDFKAAEKVLAQADVVYLYLLNETLAQIEPWLFKSIGHQTRVVSLAFSFPGHSPLAEIEARNLRKATRIRLFGRG